MIKNIIMIRKSISWNQHFNNYFSVVFLTRWLSQLLRRSAFYLRVYIANETRSDEERKELTEYLHNQLDRLECDTKRVKQELKLDLHKRAGEHPEILIKSQLHVDSILVPVSHVVPAFRLN